MLGDFVSAARRLVLGGPAQGADPHAQLAAAPMDDVRTSFSITLTVQDRLGVLARIAQVFADHGVSVARKVTYLATGEWEPVIEID